MIVTLQKSGSAEPLISVIVCTRNRAELLGRALASVVDQEFPRTDYEIVVVDNGSTDRTPQIVNQLQDQAVVRYLHEARVGLCIARNTGWRVASGRFVAFFDDDAIALPGWLAAIRDGFQVASPIVGAIGGRVDPIWEKPRPAWLADEIACSLTIVDWGPLDKPIDDIAREWLVGANMAVPRALLAEVGGFHPWLGRYGNNLMSGEEVFLQKELLRRGYRCLYCPAMAIQHLVPASRLHQQWFLRRYYWQGVSDSVMYLIENSPTPAERVSLALSRSVGAMQSRDKLALSRSASAMRSRDKIASLLFSADRPDTFSATCLALIEVGFISGLLGGAGH